MTAAVLLAAWRNLMLLVGKDITLVHGGADGADKVCKSIWHDAWLLPHEEFRPIWYPGGVYDWRAGFVRNGRMVDAGAHAAVAFDLPCAKPRCRRPEPHVSHGTEDCIVRIEAAGIPLWRWSLSSEAG